MIGVYIRICVLSFHLSCYRADTQQHQAATPSLVPREPSKLLGQL